MNNIIQILENETDGKCYTSLRYCADDELRLPSVTYGESDSFTIRKDRYGENESTLKETKDISEYARKIKNNEPLFRYFLDGSRRTYKVDDIELNRRIFPIMAGQIGVACCERKSPSQFKCAELENNLVLALPTAANPDLKNPELFLNSLANKINQTKRVKSLNILFSKVLSYKSDKQDDSKKYEALGIGAIQDEMVNSEKKIVSYLHTKNLINQDNYLIKDGSLQYTPIKGNEFKELTKYKNHYRCVIGVSKMFNPELCVDNNRKS